MDHEIEIPKWLKKFASLNDSPLYIVGGYIRNALSGLPPSDIDVAGKPLPETLRLPRGFYFATTYKRMGTALIRHRFNDKAEVEYTPFRTEEYAPGGGHVPVKVEFDADISEDAKRRDFTVNSLYMDIGTGKIYDFFDGLRDIERRVMRAYDPVAVFSSDGLRLMRLPYLPRAGGGHRYGQFARAGLRVPAEGARAHAGSADGGTVRRQVLTDSVKWYASGI